MDVVDEGYVLGRSVRLCGSWVRDLLVLMWRAIRCLMHVWKIESRTEN